MKFELNENEFLLNASNDLLTNRNYDEFVKLVCDYFFESSITDKFQSLYQGFVLTLGLDYIRLFCPEELSLLICGSE